MTLAPSSTPTRARWIIWLDRDWAVNYVGPLNRWELFCLIVLLRWRVKRTE
jgi:hypothetical protein